MQISTKFVYILFRNLNNYSFSKMCHYISQTIYAIIQMLPNLWLSCSTTSISITMIGLHYQEQIRKKKRIFLPSLKSNNCTMSMPLGSSDHVLISKSFRQIQCCNSTNFDNQRKSLFSWNTITSPSQTLQEVIDDSRIVIVYIHLSLLQTFTEIEKVIKSKP